MAGTTLAEAEAQRAVWLDCLTAIASGQRYSIAGRSLDRADLKSAQEMYVFWDQQVKRLSRGGGTGGITVRGGTPL